MWWVHHKALFFNYFRLSWLNTGKQMVQFIFSVGVIFCTLACSALISDTIYTRNFFGLKQPIHFFLINVYHSKKKYSAWHELEFNIIHPRLPYSLALVLNNFSFDPFWISNKLRPTYFNLYILSYKQTIWQWQANWLVGAIAPSKDQTR